MMPKPPPVRSRTSVLGSGTGDGVAPVPVVPVPVVPVPVVPVPVVPVPVVPVPPVPVPVVVPVLGTTGVPGINGVKGEVGRIVVPAGVGAGTGTAAGVAGANVTGVPPTSGSGAASGKDGWTNSASRPVGMNSAGIASSGKSSPQSILKRFSISAGVSLGVYFLCVGMLAFSSFGLGTIRWRAAWTTCRLAITDRLARAS